MTTLWESFRRGIIARKFVRDVSALTAANFLVAAMNFVQGILVARWLGPELYGVAALVMTYPNLVNGVFDARSVSTSVKYLGEYHALGQRDCALAMCKLGYVVDLSVACLTFLALLLTARFAAQSIVHDPAVAGLMILYGAAFIPRALVGTSNAILTTLGRFPFIAAIEIVTNSFRIVLVISLVLAGWQVAGVVLANAVAAAAAGLCYGVVAWVLIPRAWGKSIFRGSLKVLKGRRRQIFAFLAYNDLGALVGMIPKQLDTLLLGYFRNPTEVGYYRLAKSISSGVDYLRVPLYSVTYAQLARLSALGQHQAFGRTVRKLAVWIGLPLGLTVLAGTGFVPMVLSMLVGENYLPAVRAAQLLLVGSAIILAFFWLRPVYLARGFARDLFVVDSSVTLVLGLIYPLVVWTWGYMGSSSWMLGLYVLGTGLTGFWLWAQGRRKPEVTGTIKQASAARGHHAKWGSQ